MSTFIIERLENLNMGGAGVSPQAGVQLRFRNLPNGEQSGGTVVQDPLATWACRGGRLLVLGRRTRVDRNGDGMDTSSHSRGAGAASLDGRWAGGS
ncbi:MAG: hypothetical protein Q9203_002660 [Teloschistes exilis]